LLVLVSILQYMSAQRFLVAPFKMHLQSHDRSKEMISCCTQYLHPTNCVCKCAHTTDAVAAIFYQCELWARAEWIAVGLHLIWKPTGQSFSNCKCKLARTSKEADAEATPGQHVPQVGELATG
jgi:hypothetical protein